MKRIRVVIIDDDPLAVKVLSNALDEFDYIEIVAESCHLRQAKDLLMDYKPDLLFLDVEFPNMTGLDFLSSVKADIDWPMKTVFYTAFEQYMLQALRLQAFDYLVKPYSETDFENRLISVIKKVNNLHFEKVLLSTNGSKIIVLIKDIIYIEVSSHKLIYHTTNNGDITVYGSLKDISNDLEKHSFSMCNSCFLVNLNYVEKIDGYTVIVKGKELLISHPKRKKFLQDLNIFLGIN